MFKSSPPAKSAIAAAIFKTLDSSGRGYVTKADLKSLAGFALLFDKADSKRAGKLNYAQFEKAWNRYVLAPQRDDLEQLEKELVQRQKKISALKKRLKQANDALARFACAEAEKSKLEGVLESVSDIVMGVSKSGKITYLNRLASPRGRPPKKDAFIGRDLTAIFPGEIGQMVQGSLSRATRDKAPSRLEYFSKIYSNWFETRIFPSTDGAVIISSDISRRKQIEQGLREALSRFRMASEIAMLGFWEWNIGNDAVYFSPEWKKQLGYSDAELPNQIDEWKRRLHPDDRESVLQQVARSARKPAADFEIEYRLAHKDGGYRWINARWIALADAGGTSPWFAVTHLDVTSLKEEAEHLDYVASHDVLTGLPNRSLLHEFANHVMSTAHRGRGKVAVLFFDLDRFKEVNDTYGHEAGDRVLQETAQRIARSLRAEDLVGRLGGDEFVAVLGEIKGHQDVAQAATHCLESLGRPFALGKRQLHISPSIGISIFPDDGNSIETLIHNADIAMYEAKRSGGDKFCFFVPEISSRT